MPELMSKRQLETIISIPTAKLDIHCGPYGCGKTYSIDVGLGLACATTKPPKSDSCIALVGKTSTSVKSNICNVLASKFGSNFRYDSGKKDGFAKDATLFGHMLRIIGLNDSTAEDRIRGLNTYKIIGDEVSTWGEENFNKIQGRLRGECPVGWTPGGVYSTNPDHPKHWLKQMIEKSKDINYIQWTEHDNITSGALEYYRKLRERYKNNPAYLSRYVKGEWAAASGLVYPEFSHKYHVLTKEEVDALDFRSYVIAIDFGTTHPCAILLIGMTANYERVVISEVYKTDTAMTRLVNDVRNILIERHGKPIRIFCDPAAAAFIKELEDQGILGVVPADNSVLNGIDYVKDLLATDKLFICETCTNTLDEFLTYAWKDSLCIAPVKIGDDAMDALRYGLYTSRL